MHSRRFLLFLLLGFVPTGSIPSSAQAPKVKSLAHCIPENAHMAAHCKDISALAGAWNASVLGKLWEDAKFQKVVEPIFQRYRVLAEAMSADADSDDFSKAILGQGKKALQLFDSEILISINEMSYHDPEMDALSRAKSKEERAKRANELARTSIEKSRVVAVGRLKSPEAFKKGWEELSNKMKEMSVKARQEGKVKGSGKLTITSEEIGGVIVHGWQFDLADEPQIELFGYAQVDGVGIIGIPKVAVSDTVKLISSGRTRGTMAESAYGRFAKRDPGRHLSFHFNPAPAFQGMFEMIGEAIPEQQLAMMGLTVDKLIDALGISAMRSYNLGVRFGGDQTIIDSGIQFKEKKGLLNLLAFEGADLIRPRLSASETLSASISSYRIGDVYDGLLETLREVVPPLAPMIEQQIKGFEGRLGFSIRDDLLGSLGSEITTYQVPAPNDALPDQVTIIALDDADKSKEAMDFLAGFLVGASGAEGRTEAIEKIEGYDVKAFPLPAGQGSVRFLFARKQLLLGTGKGEALRQILRNYKRKGGAPGEDVWQIPAVKQARREIEPDYVHLSYVDLPGFIFESLERFVRTAPEVPAHLQERPSLKEWQALLGPVVNGVHAESSGIFGRTVIASPAQ